MKALLCVKLLRSLAGCTELCHWRGTAIHYEKARDKPEILQLHHTSSWLLPGHNTITTEWTHPSCLSIAICHTQTKIRCQITHWLVDLALFTSRDTKTVKGLIIRYSIIHLKFTGSLLSAYWQNLNITAIADTFFSVHNNTVSSNSLPFCSVFIHCSTPQAFSTFQQFKEQCR